MFRKGGGDQKASNIIFCTMNNLCLVHMCTCLSEEVNFLLPKDKFSAGHDLEVQINKNLEQPGQKATL